MKNIDVAYIKKETNMVVIVCFHAAKTRVHCDQPDSAHSH